MTLKHSKLILNFNRLCEPLWNFENLCEIAITQYTQRIPQSHTMHKLVLM